MVKKKVAAILATAAIATGGVIIPAQSAAADTPGCVDSYEWRQTKVGQGKNALENFYDTRGWTARSGGGLWIKKYYACGVRYDIVKIKYVWTGVRWVVRNGWRY